MLRLLSRGVAAALVGAIAGGASFVLAFARHPDFVLDLDRPLPRQASGFYPGERDGDRTFSWTSARATINLPEVDRQANWECSATLRGAHPGDAPRVALEIDGVALAVRPAPTDFEEMRVTASARPLTRGLSFAIVTSPTFVPGPSDRRELGVQVDRLDCRPAGGGLAWPSTGEMVGAAETAGIFGATIGLIGLPLGAAAGATLLLAVLQAIPLSISPAPYIGYAHAAVPLAAWIALVMLASVKLFEWRRPPFHPAALGAVALSAGALYLKLLALLHPAKPLIDAVFHSHRLTSVISGSYFFTQPLAGGVQFPYAIALYVVAAPWATLIRDHVALLWTVVSIAEAFAGVLLYPMIVRAWGDRRAGILAVVLFTVFPLSFAVVGNANLTNAFGQSAALVAVAAATSWSLEVRQVWQWCALAVLAAVALLAHVTTFALLFATLMTMAALYKTVGGRPLRGPAISILIATVIAAAFSVVVYYGHFSDVYETAWRARAGAPTGASDRLVDNPPPVRPDGPSAPVPTTTPLPARARHGVALATAAIGWPILILAVIGLWRVWVDRAHDRLVLTVAAWGLAFLVFAALGVAAPVAPGNERYADEFIDRAVYATYPAAVILGGRGGSWAWGAGIGPRLMGAVLFLTAIAQGLRYLTDWVQ